MSAEPSTRPTDVDPVAYCAALPTARRREEGARLLALFGEATGAPATMWGPSMIGYGTYTQTYADGSTADWFRLGFSPRKAALTLYGFQDGEGADDLLARLGKHRLSTACVYVNGLQDIDEAVLRELVERAWASDATGC